MVKILGDNIQAEIVSEQRYGSYVKYYKDGFEVTEFVSSEDYEEIGGEEE